ncbi:hypothetical protein EYF80_023550 [Liparis tanakae]|uniref:Uncharacterized protein n=1 Tax=Liparis tanakae TaxID=230148 RepID=A0A4Z2HKT9_9TELE|nr:hypothetical protein EYF80_023550 [Liparis tanakae]
MVRRSRRRERKAMPQQGFTVLDMGLNRLGKHLMRELVECKQASAHASSLVHRHLTLRATATHTDRQQSYFPNVTTLSIRALRLTRGPLSDS